MLNPPYSWKFLWTRHPKIQTQTVRNLRGRSSRQLCFRGRYNKKKMTNNPKKLSMKLLSGAQQRKRNPRKRITVPGLAQLPAPLVTGAFTLPPYKNKEGTTQGSDAPANTPSSKRRGSGSDRSTSNAQTHLTEEKFDQIRLTRRQATCF